ncbi:MAG: type II toxin-antitoxin system HicB family antitoxin [Bacteroidales bacterium]|nr:type II toxin-antitoxin system HicB family antitoxin [Bacteroidales bacterium]
MNLTAIIEKSEDGWYVGQIEEFPAAISQGKTIDELKANLIDAFMLLLETNKESTEKEYIDKNVIREDLLLV